LQCLCCERFVVQSGKHDQGNAGRNRMGPAYCFHALRIRQAQIEDDDIDNMPPKMRLGIVQGVTCDTSVPFKDRSFNISCSNRASP
jgi:hypothetical protein